MAVGTVLVANRGEVALRVIRAARRLGMRSVAVYSDADRQAPHVAEADQALRIGPAPAAESYLSVEALLDAAQRAGADAVHPGYGFLAENARFARACESAGLVFVGPQPEVIELMSRKDRARRLAHEAGAPVLPAVEGAAPGELARRAGEEVGFPCLVKAVAGGGGKGMRLVSGPGELGAALAGAGREALAAFGDGALLVERYVPAGRHLEVQVVGDGAGKVVHFFDRDCSVQRRHQKVVEEAPASINPWPARQAAIDAAVRIAAYVSYRSLGTVEFLAAGDEVYFLEMNTRLQVEHPVTEAVTGTDLVELQLCLAAGRPLRLSQEDIVLSGHAIEARVYAEDPDNGFLPQAGRATYVRWPAGVRVEAALQAGQEVGTHYDAMIAKLVADGPDREAARRKLIDGLDRTAIFGLTTNLGFLRRLVASERFSRAEVTTDWLDEHASDLGSPDWRPGLVASAVLLAERAVAEDARDPLGRDGFRLGAPPAPARLSFWVDGAHHEVLVHAGRDITGAPVGGRDNGAWAVSIDGTEPWVHVRLAQLSEVPASGGRERIGPFSLVVELDGSLERFVVADQGSSLLVAHQGSTHRFELAGATDRARPPREEHVIAQLPGTLVAIFVAAGDEVRAGDVLGMLESMKTEYALQARFDAKVGRVGFGAGAHVERGDLLFELVPAERVGEG
ncbi:MAG: biotin/lipoyl-binding protein [Actinomycetota bacterium]|nr:biotin/lipoyl-binding protein [Actinomycetota bacterium]